MPMVATEMTETTRASSVRTRILIADDQQDVLEALRFLLKGHGYTLEAVSSPTALLAALERESFDLILMDLNYARDTTSGREGIDLLANLRNSPNVPPVVVMTGWATVGLAVEAMQQGIGDFVEKPWNNTRLLEIVETQIARGRARTAARLRSDQQNQEHSLAVHELDRQKQELQEAWNIQKRLLPTRIPQFPGVEIAAAWQPARTIGGDYYDVFPMSESTVGFFIADVAGKGLPAALLMSNLQAAVRSMEATTLLPHEICARLNDMLHRSIPDDRFITFFHGQLDTRNGQLRYATAGHNAPIVFHPDGTHCRLADGGSVLGIFPNSRFELGTVQLSPGDRVVLFTDGVTEAANRDEEEFGESRVLECLSEGSGDSAEGLQRRILAAAGEFCGGHWHDDATLLVLALAR